MRDQRLKRDLARLHSARDTNDPRPEHRDALEADLLARYRDRESRTRRWLMLLNPWNRNARFALVGLALMAPLVLFASPVILYVGPMAVLALVISLLIARHHNGGHAAGH